MPGSKDLTPAQVDSLLKPLRRRRSRPWWKRLLHRLSTRVNWRLALLVVFSVLAIGVVVNLALMADATSRVQASIKSLERVTGSLSRKPGTEMTLADFDRVQASVNDLANSLAIAQRQTQLLRPFASLNANWSAQFQGLDGGRQLALAADDMLKGLQPTLFFLVGGQESDVVVSQISSGERIVELLRLGRGQFVQAQDRITTATNRLAAITLGDLAPDQLLEIENLKAVAAQMHVVNNLLLNSPDLLTVALGLTEETSYLILSQNSDELRPAGGYISTYGWLRVRSGRLAAYDYGATGPVSPNPPPLEMPNPYTPPVWWIQYQQPVYATWDGSWTPDFPATAEMAAWYYEHGNNPQAPVSGVIGIDLYGFEDILGALGDVTVPGYDLTVNRDNLRTTIYAIRASDDGVTPHKRFLTALYKAIFEQWQTVDDKETTGRLLGAVLKGLQQKHILLYFADPQLNGALDVLGWSGRQDGAIGHDYLMVVDANLGNKSNRSVVRQLTYDVEIQPDGSLLSRATVGYDFPAALAEQDPAVGGNNGIRDYANLLQVFTPLNSQLVESSNAQNEVVMDETLRHRLFITRLLVNYDGAERPQFSYTQPPLVEALGPYQRYRLLVQKQSGTRGDPASVQVTLPTNAVVVSVSPEPAASYQLERPILEFRFEMITDQWIEVIYQTG